MEQPQGFIDKDNPNLVCKLKKSLYGLKQAPRVWNSLLDSYLKANNFIQTEADPCVYVQNDKQKKTIISIYVDDLLIACNCKKKLHEIKEVMKKRFKMKDLGEATYCLGLHIQRDRTRKILTLNQTKYVTDTLNQLKMNNSKPAPTPIVTGIKLEKAEPTKATEQTPYRQTVGKLIYAMSGSRPDIAFATSYVSRFLDAHDQTHWKAVQRILRYLNGTREHSIVYKKQAQLQLEGYCDADWGGDQNDRKSTSGYVFMLCGGPISWNSKKQSTVALSSTEAEYISATTRTNSN
jgi:histone deacetylase 1/2